ncbi:MAG: 23S rRNA (pseudouridine(1915)-N(3))-methyltransferase RlmH [Magnetococcus sp. WYHC-3]
MKFRLVAVGRGMPAPALAMFEDYSRRLERHGGLELVEVAEHRRTGAGDERTRQALADEAARLLPKVEGYGPLIALDRGGRMLSSPELAHMLGQLRDEGERQICLLCGGPDGLAPELLQRAWLRLSFGPMTFPHMLFRVMLAEQIYRAMTLLAGVPYHR